MNHKVAPLFVATPKLHIWRSRRDYPELDEHLYVCAASRDRAVNLIKCAGHRRMSLHELDRHFTRDRWDKVMEGINPRPGVWIVREDGDKPETLI